MGGPDFICIGSSRCGTSFIYKQLRDHPDVWMPPAKEIHFFGKSGQRGKSRFNYWMKVHFRPLCNAFVKAIIRPNKKSKYDLLFIWRYLTGRRTDKWYDRLFQSGAFLSGDITPSYCVMSTPEIKELYSLYPNTKIIFMMRNPVDRLWSSVKKKFGRKMGRDVSALSMEELKAHFNQDGVKALTDYVTIIEKWESIFPKEQIFYGFMDEIEQTPDQFMKRLSAFLEIAVQDTEETEFKPVNDTAAQSSKVPSNVRDCIIHRYKDMVTELTDRFGSYPAKWLESYK